MDPCLIVIGLNHQTASVAVRERFWISKPRQYEALDHLTQAEGVEEIIALASCNRTEFLLWASDPTLAANSVVRFLTAEYGLKLCEWRHFYRLVDEAALLHILRVAAGLDSMVLGEPQIASQVRAGWQQAQEVACSARYLDTVIEKALTVSQRVRDETAIGNCAVPVPYAAVELARQTLGTLENRRVLLLGAGKMSALSARYLVNQGAREVRIINRTYERAQELATAVRGTAAHSEELRRCLTEADILISATSCPHFILSREEAESVAGTRGNRPLVVVDVAMPRDIDPNVRQVRGLFLYDLDDLERVERHHAGEREAAALKAQKIVEDETQGFQPMLLVERGVSTIVAMRARLDEICRQELESFKHECGPFSKDQEALFGEVTARMTRKIAGSLARELKEVPEKVDQEQMAVAIQRLFHLDAPGKTTASTRN